MSEVFGFFRSQDTTITGAKEAQEFWPRIPESNPDSFPWHSKSRTITSAFLAEDSQCFQIGEQKLNHWFQLILNDFNLILHFRFRFVPGCNLGSDSNVTDSDSIQGATEQELRYMYQSHFFSPAQSSFE